MNERHKYVLSPRDLALAHFRSASIIEKFCDELKVRNPEQYASHASMLISSAILRAFSVELGLKSLGYLESSTRERGHNLKQLFERQTSQTQSDIKQQVNAGNGRSFDDILSEIAGVFEDWRYIHEKFGTGAELGFETGELKTFAQSVFNVLNDRLQSQATP